MADYYMQVIGQFAGSLAWSFGQHISSPATEVSLAGRWHDTWAYAWAAGGTGINTLYPTGTAITAVSVSTLNGTMHEVSKTVLPLPLAGISSDDTLPFLNSIVVSWRGLAIQRYGRGRWFLPATVETVVNGDVLTSAAATRIKASVGSVHSDMVIDGSTFFVTNKKALKDGTPPFRKTIVTTPLVAMKPARQSRRVRRIPTSYT
jgi:hypothetical protein